MNQKEANDIGLDVNFKTIDKAISTITGVISISMAESQKPHDKQRKASDVEIKALADAIADLGRVALESFARLAYAQQRQADALEEIAKAMQPTISGKPAGPKAGFKTVSGG
jgi:hypothetical protein